MIEQRKQQLRDSGLTDKEILIIEARIDNSDGLFSSFVQVMMKAQELGVSFDDVQRAWKVAELARHDEQPTLQDLMQQKFGTLEAFAEAYGCRVSEAMMMLNGMLQNIQKPHQVERMAEIFGITFDACVSAAEASFRQWCVERNRLDLLEDWDLRARLERYREAEVEWKKRKK